MLCCYQGGVRPGWFAISSSCDAQYKDYMQEWGSNCFKEPLLRPCRASLPGPSTFCYVRIILTSLPFAWAHSELYLVFPWPGGGNWEGYAEYSCTWKFENGWLELSTFHELHGLSFSYWWFGFPNWLLNLSSMSRTKYRCQQTLKPA